MCGIIGYTGKENAIPRLLHGLKALEYRGYDSAGIAFFNKADLKFIKEKGRISELENKVESFGKIDTHCGIGHTRWATHGEPSAKNAHPHGWALEPNDCYSDIKNRMNQFSVFNSPIS